jgi:glycine/D-amino acid oxidase-like deaminating enzyme
MRDLGSLWRDSAAETFSAPPVSGDLSCDLLVIGGGFTGCSAALKAVGQGADVILLESDTIGHGGSGRNVGLVNAGLWLPPDTVCDTLGTEAGERLNTVLASAPDLVFDLIARHDIACEPRRAGTLHLAHAPRGLAQLKARHAQLIRRNAPVTVLDQTETAARTGTSGFHGALHDARAGTVQPLAYVRGLARAARDMGARLFENSPASEITRQGDHWIIRSNDATLRAKALLVATNAYHRPVAHMTLPHVPKVNYFQLATAPLGNNISRDILPGGEGCWDTGLIMSSLRRDAAGRVILGGMGDDTGVQAGWARRKLAQLFPQLADAEITHQWAGQISMTSDHLPRILRIGPDALSIFGYSGRGIAPGTAFGQAAAHALLTGDDSHLPLDPVGAHIERLPGLKTAIYETGARLVHAVSARR